MTHPWTPEDLFAYLDELGISVETIHHPAVYTVEESKRLRGEIPGLHVKNLFLKDRKGNFWLIVAPETCEIRLKELAKQLGAKSFSFAKPEVLMEVLGIEPGSVTPFAVVNDSARSVRVVIDHALAHGALLNFHPLTNTATTNITAEHFLHFLEATRHTPEIVRINAPEA